MPLYIIRQNIVNMKVDAIVNSANPYVEIGEGVDACIHAKAGEALFDARKNIGLIDVADVKITPGFNLKAQHVFHTVGPLWLGGNHQEITLLQLCYENALKLATGKNLNSIAFPLISTGTYGFPKDKALRVAIDVIGSYVMKHDLSVYLVVYDEESYQLSEKVYGQIENYVEQHLQKTIVSANRMTDTRSLDDALNESDATFSESLLYWIEKKHLTDVEVYKKANVDRRLFSKIRSNPSYQVSKTTAIAFAIALKLNLDESKDLIGKAGYALSPSQKFDIIIEYFIQNKIYDIFQINEALFAFSEPTIGS